MNGDANQHVPYIEHMILRGGGEHRHEDLESEWPFVLTQH